MKKSQEPTKKKRGTKSPGSQGPKKKIDLGIDPYVLLTRSFSPVIKSVLASMLVETLDQFHRQEVLHGVEPHEMSGKMSNVIEGVKQEIAEHFMGYHRDLVVRLHRTIDLKVLRKLASVKDVD